jgi:hypothetical protein
MEDYISRRAQLIAQRKQHTAERHGSVVGNLVLLYENYIEPVHRDSQPSSFQNGTNALFTTRLHIIHSSF